MELTETGRLVSGRYRLRSVIGQGGMGVVWEARDESLERDVAVKELLWPPHFTEAERDTACRRAIREAQVAGRIAHPNVVRIFDIVEEDGHPWIVMELLPYQSLSDLSREGPLTPAQVARVGLGILAALRAAHAMGVLHRDVKPANVLVGGSGRVVLTDFGVARAADSATLTTSGALVGSPSYIAPERARGGPSSPAGDLWGLGASLYTAVEGHAPFERDDPLATLTAVVTDEPEEAVHAGPLWPVISGLLRKDPDERLGAAEAERMLSEIAQDESSARSAYWSGLLALPPVAAPEPAAGPPAGTMPMTVSPTASGSAGESVTEQPPPLNPTVADSAGEPVTGQPPPLNPTVADSAGESVTGQPAEVKPTVADLADVGAPPEPAAIRPPIARGLRGTSASGVPRRLRRPAIAVAALFAAGAAATLAALALTSPPGHPVGSSGVSSAPRHSATTSAKPSATPASHAASAPAPSGTPGSTSTGSAPAASATPSSASTGHAGDGALPAGYYRFTNSTGFSIGVPVGWQISHSGHLVYITDPSNRGIFLLIDQSDTPQPNALADWRQQAANRTGTYPDYHLIRLESVTYPQAEQAADWEFTYVRDGIPVHILNRNVLANPRHAYALYWSAPQSDWDASYHYFQDFAGTFRPAP